MPFQSEKQRKYLHANHPEIAKRWEKEYATGGISNLFKLKNEGKIIDGQSHQLSYITPGEAQTLQHLGGRKVMTPEGIPAYPPQGQSAQHGGKESSTSGSEASTGSGNTGNQNTGGNQGSDHGHSRFDVGSGYYGEPKTTPTSKDDRDGPINIHDDTIEVIEEQKKTDEINRKNELRQMVRDQSEKTEKWEKAQKWTKPSTGSKIIGGLITLATMGVLGPGAAKAAKYYGYYNKAKQVKTALDTGKFEIANKEFNLSNIKNKLTSSDQKLMASLPKGHPERIALEAQMKVRTPPTDDRDGATTSIKIEDIETVNDANAEQVQLKKYQEMEWAAYLAQLEQQKLRAKQMAYWKQMMAPYMAARGGRIPGYNTGGLSNLFRLKNV